MLKRPPLLLVSGKPGAGTTTVARSLEHGLRAASGEVAWIDRVPLGTDWGALLVRAVPGLGSRRADAALLGLGDAGGVIIEMLAVLDAVDSGSDVVWDAGDVDRLLRGWAFIDFLTCFLPDMVNESLVGPGQASAGEEFDVTLAARVCEIGALLASRATRTCLVVAPNHGVESFVTDCEARVSLLGGAWDSVVVNQVPAVDGGWPEPWAGRRRDRLATLTAWRGGVAQVPMLVEEPGDSAAYEAISERLALVSPCSRPDDVVVQAHDDGRYSLRVHLPMVPPTGLRAGVLGTTLVIDAMGLRRYVPLAPVLQRCEVSGAGMRGDTLVVRFERTPALWPEAS